MQNLQLLQQMKFTITSRCLLEGNKWW